MAVNTGLADGLFFILGGVEGSLARFCRPMTGDTVNIRCKHETGGIRNSDSSYSSIKLLRSHMGILAMAFIAIGGSMRDRRNLADLMHQRCVAGNTLYLMIGHMYSVEGWRAIFCHEYLRFVMAFKALSLRHMGIPLNHAEMALLAGNPSLDVLAVIEIPTFDIDIAFGCYMAGGTTSHGAGNAVLFSLGARLVVVTDETVDFMNREVGSLNDLGVAGGTAEFHPPSELLEVFSMGKGHILIDHVSLEIFRFMAPLLEAGGVADLSVGLGGFLPGDEIG